MHSNQISKWKRQAVAGITEIFSGKHQRENEDSREEAEELYKQIGKLKVENDFLKKNAVSALSLERKREIIQLGHPVLSMRRMCKLFEISRTGLYYKPVCENEYNILLMNLIDEQFTKMPFYGSQKIRRWLLRKGHSVCREKVQRLMREMGIEAIYPHKNTSKPDKEHIIYPYLLKNIVISRPNQVWGADITYVCFVVLCI